jgi:hypothetical protein
MAAASEPALLFCCEVTGSARSSAVPGYGQYGLATASEPVTWSIRPSGRITTHRVAWSVPDGASRAYDSVALALVIVIVW